MAQELSRLDSLAQVVSLDAKRLAKDLRSRLGDIPALFSRHVSLARQMLRKLLDGHILCEPIMEGGRAGYRFTATGTFDRLLTGVKVVNGNAVLYNFTFVHRPDSLPWTGITRRDLLEAIKGYVEVSQRA